MPRPTEVISVLDPAIESEPKEVGEYMDTRELSKLKFSRARATIFHLRPISHALFRSHVLPCASDHERFYQSFRAAVTSVDHLYSDSGESVLPQWTAVPDRHGCIEEGDLDRFAPHEVVEIGSVAYQASFLARRIDLLYRLPHICLALWADQASLHAGASLRLQATASDEASSSTPEAKPPSESTTSATSKSVACTANRTAATAAAPAE